MLYIIMPIKIFLPQKIIIVRIYIIIIYNIRIDLSTPVCIYSKYIIRHNIKEIFDI